MPMWHVLKVFLTSAVLKPQDVNAFRKDQAFDQLRLGFSLATFGIEVAAVTELQLVTCRSLLPRLPNPVQLHGLEF